MSSTTTGLPFNILYPHVATLRRNLEQPVAGQSAYDGAQATAETVMAGPMAANFQIDRTGRPPDAKLPADPIGAPTMRVFFPGTWLGGPAYGMIQPFDILVDGLGQRYQVIVVEWQPIGTQVRAQLLEN
jgi:hypothetical protein